MLKQWEITLYSLMALYCTFIGDVRLLMAIIVVDAVLLCAVRIRCKELLKDFDDDRYLSARKLLSISETCFVMVIIFMVFSLVRMAYYMVFQPNYFFAGGLWFVYLIQILPTALLWVFFHCTSAKLLQVQRQKSLIDNPPLMNQEEFFAFSNTANAEDKSEEELPDTEMPDASALLDELVPDEEDFKRHLQQISDQAPPNAPQQEQLWECPFCGFMNLSDSGQCDFCGAESKQ